MSRIILPSNGSIDYFPDNKMSNYTIKPAVPLEGANYECALSEIIFPNRMVNIRKGFNQINIHRFAKKKGIDGSLKEKTEIKAGSYTTIESVIKAVSDIISKITITQKNGAKRRVFGITYNKATNLVTIQTRQNYSLSLGVDVSYLLGFKLGRITADDNGLMKGTRTGEYYASLSGGLNTMYVYSDIIKEQLVGGISAPLLRIINMKTKTNNEGTTSQTCFPLHYVPLKSSHTDTINIQLRDDTGELVQFEYGVVVVVLEFRKIGEAI
jgi:hypothetical protein